MVELVREIISYPFMVRAIIVGTVVALAASLLGVSLVLKRYSMIGDGLSHVGFGALAIATAMNAAPLKVAIPIVVFAAFILLRISESSKIKGDAAIALISTGSLAVGVVIVSMTTGMNTDVCNYLFGSILGLTESDAALSMRISVVIIGLFILCYNRIFLVTFDEMFARATGMKFQLYNMLIALLTALIIVLGMRMMGSLLISSLIVFPALTSMRVCKRFKSVIIHSAIISVICFLAGMIISYVYATPTGASIVICNIIMFLIYWMIRLIKSMGIASLKKGATAGVAILCVITLVGCGGGERSSGEAGASDTRAANAGSTEIIEIQEKMFISQINDIYFNFDNYAEKQIAVEGMYGLFYWDMETTSPIVFRNGPGCCANDGWAGFFLHYDGEYPELGDWIRVSGTVEMALNQDDYQMLQLNVLSFEKKEVRGAETVVQ